MSAPFTKDQFAFSLGNMSYIGANYEDAPAHPAQEVRQPSGGWIVRGVRAVREWFRRQAVLHEMEMMTDRELADIGLSRGDLPRVFDPAFAADRPRGQDYVGY